MVVALALGAAEDGGDYAESGEALGGEAVGFGRGGFGETGSGAVLVRVMLDRDFTVGFGDVVLAGAVALRDVEEVCEVLGSCGGCGVG